MLSVARITNMKGVVVKMILIQQKQVFRDRPMDDDESGEDGGGKCARRG